ncbi:hypothetical protein V8C35DRAFT_290245 [Trichoderma chlorosporum]
MDNYVNEPWAHTTIKKKKSNIIVPVAAQSQAGGGASQDNDVASGSGAEPAPTQGASAEDNLYLLNLAILDDANQDLHRYPSNPIQTEYEPAPNQGASVEDNTHVPISDQADQNLLPYMPSSVQVEYETADLQKLSQWSNVLRGVMSEDSIPSSRFLEVCKLRSIQLELSEGDTLVFIDFPDPSRHQSRKTDCYGMPYSSQQFRMHSEKLRATGSAKFAEMLSPTYQFRIQRRRKLAKNLPEGIKYVLDFTPPSEGDELVFQMTQLSLTPGIIKWWAASGLHKVSKWLVSGHDDVCTCGQPPIPGWGAPKEWVAEQKQDGDKNQGAPKSKPNIINGEAIVAPSPQDLLAKQFHGINRSYETPKYRDIPDYCPIRHCNNIIRLMMMIEGHEVMLDSANRVWTLVALAKIFDCTSVVRDRVTQWIMSFDNTKFIEVLPEEALQIGFTLELVQVTQCAFRILVNELALKEASTLPHRHESRHVTVFGRRLGDLDDELHNIVQHAARALVERVSSIPDSFRSQYSLDCWMAGEWVKLRQMEGALTQLPNVSIANVHALDSIRDLLVAIQTTVSSAFDDFTAATNMEGLEALISMDQDRATYVLPDDFELLVDILPRLNLTQKLLCPFVYQWMSEMWDPNCIQPKWLAKTNSFTYGSVRMQLQRAHMNVQKMFGANPELAISPSLQMFLDREEGPLIVKDPLIDLTVLNRQIHDATLPYSSSWVRFDVAPPLNMTRHMLLTLDNNEMKFLPLWAGGCNDGTGGVFEPELPPAQWGPNGPGPAYHTGNTIPSTSSVSGSFIDDFSTMRVKGSTVVGSVDAQDSISTVYAPGHVIADDASILSESFDTDGAEYYQEARFVVPAEHQDTGRAVDMMVESLHSDADTASVTTDRLTMTGSHDDSGDDDVMNIDDPAAGVIAQSDESDSDASTLEAWDEL